MMFLDIDAFVILVLWLVRELLTSQNCYASEQNGVALASYAKEVALAHAHMARVGTCCLRF